MLELALLDLSVLGSFELRDSRTGTAIAVSSHKTRALLALLSVSPDYTAPRSRVASLLWSDSAEEKARQSLRQLLSNVRRTPLHDTGLLQYDEADVWLNAGHLRVDVQQIYHPPAPSDLAASLDALSSYRGPFGQGLETGEAYFDEWLLAERQKVDEHVIALSDQLVRRLSNAGRHRDALKQANALLAMNPLREETHRLIIAEEAVVSGRASAMQRYEDFRVLLRDELAVRPEPATVQLIDRLRELPHRSTTSSRQPITEAEEEQPHEVSPAATRTSLPRRNSRVLAACLLLVICAPALALAFYLYNPNFLRAWGQYAGEAEGRTSVVLLPFEGLAPDQTARDLKDILRREGILAFSRNNRVTLVDILEKPGSRARYVVKTHIVFAAGRDRADLTLIYAETGSLIWSSSIPVGEGPPTKFARELYGSVFSEIVLHQAQLAPTHDESNVPGMLWRARASQLRTRLGVDSPDAIVLYRAALAREPENLVALLGLSDCLILRVARNQSVNRPADIAEAQSLLLQAKPLAPNSSDVAFKEGMLSKLQGQFERASSSFEQALRIDPAHWNAAAQYAHVMIFLGRLEEGFTLMEQCANNLLPDLGAAETAYIAGETALAAGRHNVAVRYLSMAVTGNPTVGRIHALYAAALQLADRGEEARQAADHARKLSPQYTPEVMAQRGGPNASPQYADARQRMVEAFRTARLASSSSL